MLERCGEKETLMHCLWGYKLMEQYEDYSIIELPKNRTTTPSYNLPPGHIFGQTLIKKYTCTPPHVPSSTIHNIQDTETT